MIDLQPAAARMADLLRAIPDGALSGPTPCTESTVGDLVDHVGGLTVAFTAAAAKSFDDRDASQGPSADGSRLSDNWRAEIPQTLSALVDAWRDPDAWTGMTKAGGVDLPGEVAGLVALDELVVHAWDIARATGQPYEPDDETIEACHGFVDQFSGPGHEEERKGLFGPVVDVPADAPALERLIGATGRDPRW